MTSLVLNNRALFFNMTAAASDIVNNCEYNVTDQKDAMQFRVFKYCKYQMSLTCS